MYINIFLKEIFNKRIITEYIIVLLIWFGILLNFDTSSIIISNSSFNILVIIITFIMTYYMANGLLSFECARDYLSLPISSQDYIMNLSWALSIWLLATKYSYLIILYFLIVNQIGGALYMFAIGLVAVHISLLLIVNFYSWKLVILNMCSVLIMILIEIKIESISTKLLIYLPIVVAIIYSYKKVNLNTIIITKLNTKISNMTIDSYFFNIFVAEQILLINSGINILVAIVFAISEPAYYLVFIPIPYSVLALNSGVSTMMSSELATRETIKQLPPNRMFLQYIVFVYAYFLIVNSLLGITMIIVSPVYIRVYLLLLLIIPIVETFTIVVMESKFPIKAWKVKPDLWRSYRKYIPPVVVFITCLLIISSIFV